MLGNSMAATWPGAAIRVDRATSQELWVRSQFELYYSQLVKFVSLSIAVRLVPGRFTPMFRLVAI